MATLGDQRTGRYSLDAIAHYPYSHRTSGSLVVRLGAWGLNRLELELGLGLGLELALELGFDCFLSDRSRYRTRVTVLVTSRRYRQTNSTQALKETNRFTVDFVDPCSYARVSGLCIDVLGLLRRDVSQ